MSLISIICIGSGGFIGAVLRALSNALVAKIFPNLAFPLGTLFVNVLGGFLIGFILSLASSLPLNPNLKSFLVTGILGGLTTFSTFTYENMLLLNSGNFLNAFLNIFLNVVLCIIFCYIGANLAKFIF
ncbi:putative fluoride ion transporter [Campylobacter iguaniorum]|uniref:Fluoride-specific ion channel FluC n=1 Tax=Campylobacter iguaniorum TaxID=1244531 RepID=A0A076F9H5_9BACT|nr:fluoride efflux transporter CrcB [Campylobacter iguaniorum]AII14845.1 putative fluoride ion transporter [Campylobacter iguaniorum]